MARGPNEKIKQAEELYKKKVPMVEIAKRLNVAAGTVRSWKNRYEWDGDKSATLQKNKRNVAKRKANAQQEQKRVIADEVIGVTENSELTDKQRLFCIYYIRCFNATKAYQKAYGCDYVSAMQNGSRMLRNDKVKEEILKLKQERLNREFLSESDIFQKYMDIAFADITDYMKFGTEEVPVMSLYGPVKVKDEETGKEKILTKTVNVARFKESANVDGTILNEVKQGKDGASIKLADRMKALQWLSDHMDLATEKQRAEIALSKARADAGKNDKEDKLDKLFEQIEGALKDAE